MASITIRQLDEDLKRRLRLRAARHGRSMEDEARTILRGAASAEEGQADSKSRLAEERLPNTRSDSTAREAPHRAPSSEREHLAQPQRQERGKRVLLIIGGGIAAYKSLELIRRLKERSIAVPCILTQAAQEFITPLSAGALSGERVFTDLFDASSEFDVGHIRLARDADLIVVAPATADLMAKLAQGSADDLACAVLLATNRPVLIAPAMNPHMWAHPATRRNLATLMADGLFVVGPKAGEMAEEGEAGTGRMAEPDEIAAAALPFLVDAQSGRSLRGKRVIVTSGPTQEPIDPVRYIANRSSGKQGHAIAAAAAVLGAEVMLVSGPVNLLDPPGVRTIKVETAQQMLTAVMGALPADVAVLAAAVADWRIDNPSAGKLKKEASSAPTLALVENPDILATVARKESGRPPLVIGFAAETERIVENAKAKLLRKGCDWIVANDVSASSGVMGGDRNTVHIVTAAAVESWPPQSKEEVARALVARIADALAGVKE